MVRHNVRRIDGSVEVPLGRTLPVALFRRDIEGASGFAQCWSLLPELFKAGFQIRPSGDEVSRTCGEISIVNVGVQCINRPSQEVLWVREQSEQINFSCCHHFALYKTVRCQIQLCSKLHLTELRLQPQFL